ncbi:unnamed protein product, partial [Iphiclides podalirius]
MARFGAGCALSRLEYAIAKAQNHAKIPGIRVRYAASFTIQERIPCRKAGLECRKRLRHPLSCTNSAQSNFVRRGRANRRRDFRGGSSLRERAGRCRAMALWDDLHLHAPEHRLRPHLPA